MCNNKSVFFSNRFIFNIVPCRIIYIYIQQCTSITKKQTKVGPSLRTLCNIYLKGAAAYVLLTSNNGLK